MTQAAGFATYCNKCDRAIRAQATDDPRVYVTVEYLSDRFTPSDIRHVCYEGDRLYSLLIAHRAERAAQPQAA